MRHETSLPAIFVQYNVQVRYIQRVSDTEWSSTCHHCQGEVHPGGELPDRCRWFTRGKNLGWCRRCGGLFWPDGDKLSPAQLTQWREEQKHREQERKRSAERAMKHLRHEALWKRYHQALSEQSRDHWRKRGVSDSMQDYWQLGWKDRWTFPQPNGSLHHTPSLTIPIFGQGWAISNVKHRLISPPEKRSKYIYEVRGQGAPLFLCQPDKALEGQIIAVEGEIKSMVCQLHLGAAELVVGLPGAAPGKLAIGQLSKADRVTLIMDPGSEEQADQLAGKIGRQRCRILVTPVKIDDGILAGNLTQCELQGLLRSAVPA